MATALSGTFLLVVADSVILASSPSITEVKRQKCGLSRMGVPTNIYFYFL